MTFRNAEQLYTWLKPASHMLESEYWPAESRRIKSFQKTLTERDLAQSCAQWPQWLGANLNHESTTQHGKGAA